MNVILLVSDGELRRFPLWFFDKANTDVTCLHEQWARLAALQGQPLNDLGAPRWRLQARGQYLTVHVELRQGVWHLTVWGGVNNLVLAKFQQPIDDRETDTLWPVHHNRLLEIASALGRDTYPCQDCGSLTPSAELGGQYFAAVYCQTCWHEHGHKQKAANETYD